MLHVLFVPLFVSNEIHFWMELVASDTSNHRAWSNNHGIWASICIRSSNVIDDNGDPHFEKLATLIAPHVDKLDDEFQHIAQNLLSSCQNPQGTDKCERAFSIHKW